MNPNVQLLAIVAERMQALQAEADTRGPAPGRLRRVPPAPGWPAAPGGGWRSPGRLGQ